MTTPNEEPITLPATPLAELYGLKGKVAFVTGGARGIGQAAAFRLAEAGAHVVIGDSNQEGAVATAAAIRDRGVSAEGVGLDVTDASGVTATINRVAEKHGRFDVLVNNAGIFPFRPFFESDDALWQKTYEVNVMGAMRCTRAAAPHMARAGGGSVVNLASIAGMRPEGDLAHYETSKGAVLMMTKSLAWELKELRIRVNAVAPGGIQTPGARMSIEPLLSDPKKLMARSRGFFQRIALKRMGEPDDVARAILFLATPMSDYVTGAMVLVDGGFLLS
ncbi:MAG: oxidoreductase, short chain dehydrogenase [Myxococcales bacterium]|nr:oxidoreductase, short chain dehydrogenase [Myxococcales bacterium]